MRTGLGIRHALAAAVVLAGLGLAVRRVAADAPAGRYVIMNDATLTGTVADTKTGLTWQQAAPSTLYDWSDAMAYCAGNMGGLPGAGWRLPSAPELQTIVDDSRYSPAIDPTAFPCAPSTLFWSSTATSFATGEAWGVTFADGTTGIEPLAHGHLVRCVR